MPEIANTSVFSQTDASNNTGTMPSGSGSALPSTIDDAGRALQGAVVREWNWSHPTITSGGAANVQTLTYSIAPAAYYNGQQFTFLAGFTNSGSATLNVNALGAVTIKKVVGSTQTALAGNEILTGQIVTVHYNTVGTCFILSSAQAIPALTIGSEAQGDLIYRDATGWTRLGAGTSGQYLKTLGAGANPAWGTLGWIQGTPVTTTSGTTADFTSLPTGIRVIHVILTGVSASGTDSLEVRIGDSGGVATTGYSGSSCIVTSGTSVAGMSTGFTLYGGSSDTSGAARSGIITLSNLSGNIWVASGSICLGSNTAVSTTAATKTLSNTLDRVRVAWSGANTFDAGSVNIVYQ